MSKRDSIQKKLQRVRPPRVQLTYDVEIGDAIEQKELPFVMGVIGDFAGQSEVPQAKLKDKKFVNVDLDNFDEVMTAIEPKAKFRVANKISDKGGEFAVDLTFKEIDDFRPEAIVQQIDPLRQLVEARNKLADLRNKIAGSEKLEDVLNEVLHNTEMLNKLSASEKQGDSNE